MYIILRLYDIPPKYKKNNNMESYKKNNRIYDLKRFIVENNRFAIFRCLVNLKKVFNSYVFK